MGWPTRVGGDLLSSLSYVLRRRCLSSPSRIREGPSAFALPSSGLPVLPAGALPPKDTVADLVSRFGHREIAVGTHQSQSRLLQLKDLVSYEEITGSIFHCNSMPLHEMCKTGALQDANLKGNNKAKDGLITDGTVDPWNPPYAPSPQFNDCEHAKEWLFKATDFVANSRETNIIILDRTPQWVRDGLWRRVPELVSILEEDDVQRFLRFFSNNRRCMAWGFIITPETFNYIVSENALKCAKVTLEGKASELSGNRASPNYMNPYGYFPLHEAAERFSVDMVKLLFEYGASTNDHLHYIYKLIQLLCLPKMAARNRLARGGSLEYTRNSFFPYWRSVLLSNVDAAADPKRKVNLNKQHCSSVDQGSPPTIRIHSLALVGRTQQTTSYHTCSRLFCMLGRTPQATSSLVSRRLFGTAVLTFLKVLKINA
ncbi:hypothetical protein U9M48_037596 [Paspalum notatum var. saurae]|uniref:Uncharacterized protein n=1 Tax=Paspalum notatum var. saurae TaxID=547442 RepID=A0AAQ3UFX5_PASNO